MTTVKMIWCLVQSLNMSTLPNQRPPPATSTSTACHINLHRLPLSLSDPSSGHSHPSLPPSPLTSTLIPHSPPPLTITLTPHFHPHSHPHPSLSPPPLTPTLTPRSHPHPLTLTLHSHSPITPTHPSLPHPCLPSYHHHSHPHPLTLLSLPLTHHCLMCQSGPRCHEGIQNNKPKRHQGREVVLFVY